MPTYGYECLACANQFEVFQSIKDAPLSVCDSCGGTLRKRVYPVGIAFKGSGFYVNDYAKKSAAPPSSSETKSETPTAEAKSETPSAEAKSEAPKTETKMEKTPATTAA